MIKHTDFTDAVCQASLFFPQGEIVGYKILAELLPKWKIFDKDPEILPDFPMSPGVQVDVPTLILKSKNEEWRYEFSRTRINFFQNKILTEPDKFQVQQFPNIIDPYVKPVIDLFKPRAGRMAFVVRRFFKTDQPGLKLAEHFCKEAFVTGKALNRSKNFELHSHKEYQPSQLPMINSWIRCKTADLKAGNETFRTIFIEQDLNTLDQEKDSHNFSWEDIETFFKTTNTEAQTILERFFPSQKVGG